MNKIMIFMFFFLIFAGCKTQQSMSSDASRLLQIDETAHQTVKTIHYTPEGTVSKTIDQETTVTTNTNDIIVTEDTVKPVKNNYIPAIIIFIIGISSGIAGAVFVWFKYFKK